VEILSRPGLYTAGRNGARTVTLLGFQTAFNLTDTVTFLPTQSADVSLSQSRVALLPRRQRS